MGIDIKAGWSMKKTAVLFAVFAAAAILLVLAIPAVLDLAVFLGKRIPQTDLKADYIKGLLWAIFLGATIFAWPIRSEDKKALLLIWAVKCVVMLGIMLFYEYHYQIDPFGLFSGARYGMAGWKKMDMMGSFAVLLITWLHQHLFLDSFRAVTVSCGMIGLVGVYVFYRAAAAFLRQEKPGLLYFFALFPSILFWSSTFGKEPLMLLTIAVYCYGIINWYRSNSVRYLVIMVLGIAFSAFIRVWLGIILVVPLLVFPFVRLKSMIAKITSVVLVILAVIFFTGSFMKHYNISSLKELPYYATQKCQDFSRGGSGKDLTRIEFKSMWDMICFVPRGMYTALFRPLPGEVNNIFGILAGLEDAFLIILFALAIKRARWRELTDPLFIWAILLIMIWAAAYGFVGFNLGTVYRYRIQILPIFLGLLLYQMRSRKIS